MKGIKYIIILLPIFVVAFYLVFNPRDNDNERYIEPENNLEYLTWFVDDQYTLCGEDQLECLSVKEDRAGDYAEFDGTIEGFNYVEGAEYQVRVLKEGETYTLDAVVAQINPNGSNLVTEANYEKVTRADITTLESEILTPGIDGFEVQPGDRVVANYRGWLATNGEEFDSSFKNGASTGIEFSLTGVIQGWQEGVPGMKLGEVRRLFIPSELAYGEQATGSIPANSDLIFDIELMEIK